jgi:hypothetical protein
MRNLRVITDQLNADFAGMRKDAPLVIKFEDSNGVNADSVVFFTTGDFQDASGVVRGNVARIYYGQATIPDPFLNDPKNNDKRNKILARKQVILAPAEANSAGEHDPNSFIQEVKEYLKSYIIVSDQWLSRPQVNPNNGNDIPMYLAKGVDNFSIMHENGFNAGNIQWGRLSGSRESFYVNSYPRLIKFTFTLYDSKGIIKTGRRFEHIVYIGK